MSSYGVNVSSKLHLACAVYAEWIDSHVIGGEEKAFREMSLDERMNITRAIQTLKANKKVLKAHEGDYVITTSEHAITNKDILKRIESSAKTIYPIGRAELVLANRYLNPILWEKQIAKLHGEILELPRHPKLGFKQSDVFEAMDSWVDSIDAGEDKEIASYALKGFKIHLESLLDYVGLFPSNIESAFGVFQRRVFIKLADFFEGGLTPADKKAGGLDVTPLFNFTSLKAAEKKLAFILADKDSHVDSRLERLTALASEVKPSIRYPKNAGFYAAVQLERAKMLSQAYPSEAERFFWGFAEDAIVWARYAAEFGDARGASVIVDFFSAFRFGPEDTEATFKIALKYADVAIQNSNGEAARHARIAKADLITLRYEIAIENSYEANIDLTEIIKAQGSLGVDGLPGLYSLFKQGSIEAGEAMLKVFEKYPSGHISSKNLEMLTALALADIAGAKEHLEVLSKEYPKNLDLHIAEHFVVYGHLLSPNPALDKFKAIHAYNAVMSAKSALSVDENSGDFEKLEAMVEGLQGQDLNEVVEDQPSLSWWDRLTSVTLWGFFKALILTKSRHERDLSLEELNR